MRCIIALVVTFTLCLALPPAANASGAAASWQSAPVIPRIKGKLRKHLAGEVAKSLSRGHRRLVFAKVGDSNSEMAGVSYGLGCRAVKLNGRHWLKRTIRRYNRTVLPAGQTLPGCRRGTSFSRRSSATRIASWSYWSLGPVSDYESDFWDLKTACGARETPLSCELLETRPAFVFIMTGTNDLQIDRAFNIKPGSQAKSRITELVEAVRRLGSVPILSTLPPVTYEDPPATIDGTNAAIFEVAREARVPLVNLWRGLVRPSMINQGLAEDGLHLSVYRHPGPQLYPAAGVFRDSVDFRPEAIRHGANFRNLTWVKVLARLDQATG